MLKTKLSTSCAAERGYRCALAALRAARCAALLVLVLLGGCAYQLSGSDDTTYRFAPVLKNVSIEGVARYDAFRIQLKRDVLAYRIKVVPPELATTRIVIKDKNVERQTITLGDDAKVREYLLIASINFYLIVNDDNAEPRQSELQTIQSQTSYAYYPQHVSISRNERKRAVDSLNRAMSARLIDRLRVLQ